jgi:hypothetical protein
MIFSSFSGAGGSSIRIGQSFPRLITHPQSVGSISGIALKRLNQEYLKTQGQLFMNTTSSKLDIIIAGEEALTCVYGGLPLEGLDIFR